MNLGKFDLFLMHHRLVLSNRKRWETIAEREKPISLVPYSNASRVNGKIKCAITLRHSLVFPTQFLWLKSVLRPRLNGKINMIKPKHIFMRVHFVSVRLYACVGATSLVENAKGVFLLSVFYHSYAVCIDICELEEWAR